jgi:multiple sugar transport system substrate-binding protein
MEWKGKEIGEMSEKIIGNMNGKRAGTMSEKRIKTKTKTITMTLAALILAICMLASIALSGCDKGAAAKEGEQSAGGEPIELEFWYAGGKTAAGVLAEIVEEFNSSQDAWHVTPVMQSDYTETYQKLQAGIAGGTAPDIALLGVGHATSLAEKDLLEDLEPLIAGDSGFDRDDYMEVFFDAGTLEDGTIFALPAYGTTQILYYNIAAFEKAGIDPESIKTWQDLESAARAMTVKEGEETTFYGWEPMWGYANLIDASLSNGAQIFSDDGKTVMVNSEEWIEVWSAFGDWLNKDKIMAIHHGGQGWEYWYKTIDDVLQNKAGGYTGSSGDQADLDFTIVAAMEQPGWGSNPSMPAADALQLSAPKQKNPDTEAVRGAYEFMKFFTSPENQAKWSMATGYIAVRKSTAEVDTFKAYADKNPQALVPMNQAMHGAVLPIDPTGGKVYDALNVAADKVEIEGVPAKEALDEAQKTAQTALDEALGK